MVNALRLKISLASIDPAPWRVVDVPVSMNLTGLHRTIQGAFLWHDCHLWHFEVGEKRYGPLWVGGEHEGFYNPDNKRLSFLTKLVGQDFRYVYDMGDWWEHRIEILDQIYAPAGTRLPIFIEGAGRTPPEDVGGPPGFTHFLESLADPGHPDHGHMLNSYGQPFDADDIEETIVRIMLKREAAMRPPVK